MSGKRIVFVLKEEWKAVEKGQGKNLQIFTTVKDFGSQSEENFIRLELSEFIPENPDWAHVDN